MFHSDVRTLEWQLWAQVPVSMTNDSWTVFNIVNKKRGEDGFIKRGSNFSSPH